MEIVLTAGMAAVVVVMCTVTGAAQKRLLGQQLVL
jgi:hypothetical protein